MADQCFTLEAEFGFKETQFKEAWYFKLFSVFEYFIVSFCILLNGFTKKNDLIKKNCNSFGKIFKSVILIKIIKKKRKF